MDEETKEKIADALHEVTDAEMLEAIEHFLDGDSDSKIRSEMGITRQRLTKIKLEIKQLLEQKGIQPKQKKNETEG
jgi:hypothetical protein